MEIENWWTRVRGGSPRPCLTDDVTSDVVIVGGGTVGLTAAHLLAERGYRVAVIERARCGGGATGASAGFVAPDCDLPLAALHRRYGESAARELWSASWRGVRRIEAIARNEKLSCDLRQQDTLVLGSGWKQRSALKREMVLRTELGEEARLYEGESVKALVRSADHKIAVRLGGTFGINPYAYATELARTLEQRGVRIYEDSEVCNAGPGFVRAGKGSIRAPYVLLCGAQPRSGVGHAAGPIRQARSYVAVTHPIDEKAFWKLFPGGEFQCRLAGSGELDFRPLGGMQRRLVVSVTDTLAVFSDKAARRQALDAALVRMRRMLGRDVQITFSHAWSALMPVTPDILPMIWEVDEGHGAKTMSALASPGLQWATLAGEELANCVSSEGRSATASRFLGTGRKNLFEWARPLDEGGYFLLNAWYSMSAARDRVTDQTDSPTAPSKEER